MWRRSEKCRQATLRGAIQWSWELLSPAEREALLKVGACYVMLADYVVTRLDHATAHRDGERRDIQPDS